MVNQFTAGRPLRRDDLPADAGAVRAGRVDPPGGHRLRQQRLSSSGTPTRPAATTSARGIAPPDSGHPKFNKHADDIDYQIEADFSGLIAPGLPNVAIELGEKFGRLMNYGDGLYGGQFVGGMYAEAFFENDPAKHRRGRPAVHPRRKPVRRVHPRRARLARGEPRRLAEDLAEDRREVPERTPPTAGSPATRASSTSTPRSTGPTSSWACSTASATSDQTIIIAMPLRPGLRLQPVQRRRRALHHDRTRRSCPSGSPRRWIRKPKFSHTAYNFPRLLAVCEKLARAGGRPRRRADRAGRRRREVFVIPVGRTQAEQARTVLGARAARRQTILRRPTQGDRHEGPVTDRHAATPGHRRHPRLHAGAGRGAGGRRAPGPTTPSSRWAITSTADPTARARSSG